MTLSGQIISKIRESKMMTQEELADQIGVSRQTLAMWEIGKRLPTDSVIILTARFFEINENELLSLLQHERLKTRVERLQDQYGAKIVIINAPNNGGIMMSNPKYTAYQIQQGVHFAITHIYKSLNYEYPETLMKDEEAFRATFETPHSEERLIIKAIIKSENEGFILNGRYSNNFEIVDNLGNHYYPVAGGIRCSIPPEPSEQGVGGIVEVFAHFKYVPEAQSITLRQKVASMREEDCDFITFEDVELNDSGISKQSDGVTVTYDGIGMVKVGNSPEQQEYKQIQIQLHEHGNPTYVGIHKYTDNLGNEYKIHGWSWTTEENTREGFLFESLDPEAESISFKYWLSRKILNFELLDLTIPS
jgi:transcriptional regulator with XRE-family HTH domain